MPKPHPSTLEPLAESQSEERSRLSEQMSYALLRPMVLNFFLLALILNGFFVLFTNRLARRFFGPRPLVYRLTLGVSLWAGLMSALLFCYFFLPISFHRDSTVPIYFAHSLSFIWTILFLLPAVAMLGYSLLRRWLWQRLKLGLGKVPSQEAKPSTASLTRRDFIRLTALGAAPTLAMGAGVYGTATRFDLRVQRPHLYVPNLPPALEGFCLTHLSDIHSGKFCGPHRLKIIRDAANDLRSPLVLVTGDIINHAAQELPPALAMLKQIEAKAGLYISQGNHDIVPGNEVLPEGCRLAGLPCLIESSLRIPYENASIHLAGLPWIDARTESGLPALKQLYRDSRLEQKPANELRLLMAHHPDVFDDASPYADLVLSGHTHGGQLMLGSVGLGPLIFKHWSGLYHANQSAMFVSNGCGDWFPCRIGAPAEIVQITLTAQTTS